MKHLTYGNIVKAVCYIPMFTDEIPLICKDHYQFIIDTAEMFRSLGASVDVVTGETYCHYVLRRSSRGKFKGRMFGFPLFKSGQCGFKRDSKIKALTMQNVGYYDYEDIGIAADEVARHGQLTDKKRSILYELGMTENDAKRFCVENDVLSPHYKFLKRDGCTLCPNANPLERARWFHDYPEAVPLVIDLQQQIVRERPDIYPLRGHKWFLENGNHKPLSHSEWLNGLSKGLC